MNGTETRRAFVFMGGKNFSPEHMTDIPEDNDLIVAADSGCFALSLFCEKVKKISPDIILGDMDSFDLSESRMMFPDSRFITLPAKKDKTDTALAVDVALDNGCKTIFIAGGVGGRLDHTLAVVYLLEYIREKGADGILTDGKNRVYLAKEENLIRNKRKYVSLIPLDKTIYGVGMDENFEYPYKAEQLERSNFPTISNELTSDSGYIYVKSGSALIIETED